MSRSSTRKLIGALVCARVITSLASAQQPDPPEQHEQHEHAGHAAMAASLFPARDASGTSWLPDTSPMYGAHVQRAAWQAMLHGNLFVQYLNEFAPIHRGGDQFGSINWFMAMARRPIGKGAFGLRAMFSAEPWSIRGCGYPDLLATGELCDRDGIHDRQHPHDLFMELAAEYERPLGAQLRWHVYGGPAGEPALGPPAFPHRASAMPNPLAPISHHWLDATHITYGVVTTGISGTRWRAEASAFNGREPDENRKDFDLAALDSVSGRVTLRPRASLALQVSAGHLSEAEVDYEGGFFVADVDRITASAIYHRRLRRTGLLAATAAWGTNRERGRRTHAAFGEASVSLSERHVFFGRLEVNGKPAHDLHIHEQPGAILTVAKAQVGYTHYLPPRSGLQAGVGGSLSAGIVPASIRPQYGGIGLGVGVFATLRPAAHSQAEQERP